VFAVAQVLGIAGYVPPVEEAGKLVEQPQSAGFILALRLVFVLLPVAFISLGILFAARFPLTAQAHGRLAAILAAMRSGKPLTEEQARDRSALQAELVRR
jgi:Na+/melibiose symporter-like transporter